MGEKNSKNKKEWQGEGTTRLVKAGFGALEGEESGKIG